MKQWISCIISIICFILFPVVPSAHESSLDLPDKTSYKPQVESSFTPKEMKWLENKQAITYVYDPDWAPFEWKNEIDNHTGIISDVLSLIQKNTGIKFIPVNTDTWEESVELVKSKKVNMFSAITQNSSREEYLNFTSKNIFSYPAVLITKFDDKKVYLNIGKDLKGKKIGIVKGSGLGQYIKVQHPELEYVELPSTRDGFSSIQNNTIDLFAINTVTAKYYIEKKGFDDLKIALKLDYVHQLKIAIHKNLPSEIISILDKSLTSISEQELNDILNKWTEIPTEQHIDWKLLFQIAGILFFVIILLTWSNRRLNLKVKARTEELVAANIKLGDNGKKLQRAIKKAEAASNAKSEFLSLMSHEMRTPLHGIIGLQNLIGTDAEQLSREQQENLILAQQSAKSLQVLVNDVLDLAKVESGNMELVEEPFELKNCICDAIVPFVLSAREKKIVITLHIEEAPKSIIGDELRLRQVLLNLIGNSVKFTDQGEITVHVIRKESQLHFSIKDTGVGISKTDLETIFEPFKQGRHSARLTQTGTGLGTSIVKRFIDLMRGKIEVSSELGKGSCFLFTVPCNSVGSETINIHKSSSDGIFITAPNLKEEKDEQRPGLRVLLAEDDPIAQRIVFKQLSKAGMQVDITVNGESAWKKVQDQTYDLLLTDIRMPGMDGIELTKKIRMLETHANKPRLLIIGLSAHALEDVVSECLEAGMDHFMTKPVDPEAIQTTVINKAS